MSNSTTEITESELFGDSVTRIVAQGIVIFAILGMAVSLVAFLKIHRGFQKTHSPQLCLLLSITLSDLLGASAIIVEFFRTRHTVFWYYSLPFLLSGFLSMFLLALFQYRVIVQRNAYLNWQVMLAGFWIFALAIGTGPFLYEKLLERHMRLIRYDGAAGDQIVKMVLLHLILSPLFAIWIVVYCSVVTIVQPILIVLLTIFYLKIHQQTATRSLRFLRAPGLLVARVVSFGILWLPIALSISMSVISSYYQDRSTLSYWVPLSGMLIPAINAVVNPFLYAFQSWDGLSSDIYQTDD